jgi:hypothetical protein
MSIEKRFAQDAQDQDAQEDQETHAQDVSGDQDAQD